MKLNTIKQLILRFIGGGKIQIPTKFLKSVDIESPDINQDDGVNPDDKVNPDEIFDFDYFVKEEMGIDYDEFTLDDSTLQEIINLNNSFNNNNLYSCSFINSMYDGSELLDSFNAMFDDKIKYIKINNINTKIVEKIVEDNGDIRSINCEECLISWNKIILQDRTPVTLTVTLFYSLTRYKGNVL